MARVKDWVALARSTIRSLEEKDVAGLYAFEWPEAKRSLISEYEEEIAGEQRKPVRWARFASALVYGLAKRLTPQRRLLFAGSLLLTIGALVVLLRQGVTFSSFLGLVGSYLVMMLLLALELLDKLKFRDELELARELQAALIPEKIPALSGFDMHAYNQIANLVGGDLYDFAPLHDGRMAVLFGDASGHGMSAGLVMAVAHASFRTQLDVDPQSEVIVGSLNRILCRTGGPRSFFAGVYLLLDSDGGFEVTVAGHPPVLVIDSSGRVIDRIGEGAYPLGIKNDVRWKSVRGHLAIGEMLVLYSDGLVESRSPGGTDYGFERVEQVAGANARGDSSDVVRALVGDWQSFMGPLPIQDDLSIAVIRRVS